MTIEQATKQLIDSLKSVCGSHGLGNDGNEYKIIIQIFLYKFFNDKFGYEAKRTTRFGKRLSDAEKWDAEYDKFTDDEVLDLFDLLPPGTPRLRPEHTISHLYNAIGSTDYYDKVDSTMLSIGELNSDIFSVVTSGGSRYVLFEKLSQFITDEEKRTPFFGALMSPIANSDSNFDPIFSQKYDFFSSIFEYLIKDYNNASGTVYAEYYTPRSIALIMARLLVGRDTDLRNIECYDPAAGTGTLLMALAHVIGEDRCSIYSQDISQKSTKMLMLNLILNNLVSSLRNTVHGNTLTEPSHKNSDDSLKQFDYVVSNPPFNLDFSDYRKKISENTVRFWAGVPNITKKDKKKMKIYLCFIQHVINSLRDGKGKGAIVVPTGFISAKNGIEKKILQKIVNEGIVYGCISMPSNVFATTGTNVSVLFFDKSKNHDKVVLIDASKLGEEYKDGKNQRNRLRDFEIDKIVNTFINETPIDDFSVVVGYDEIKEKGYNLSAGQYFDVKIEYFDITEEEFNSNIAAYKALLKEKFEESHKLEEEILTTTDKIVYA